jgi:hypothetical protein
MLSIVIFPSTNGAAYRQPKATPWVYIQTNLSPVRAA